MGILELSKKLADHIDSGKVLKPGEQEIELRAVSIVACDMIVEKAKQKYPQEDQFNALKLDHYLWMLGKEDGFRQVERHYTREMVFY